jgi:hypothetical protein
MPLSCLLEQIGEADLYQRLVESEKTQSIRSQTYNVATGIVGLGNNAEVGGNVVSFGEH